LAAPVFPASIKTQALFPMWWRG